MSYPNAAAANAYNSSITQTIGTGVTGISQAPWLAATYQTSSEPTHNFQIVKSQNGWVLHYEGKSWICKDVEEAANNLVVALVEKRIEK